MYWWLSNFGGICVIDAIHIVTKGGSPHKDSSVILGSCGKKNEGMFSAVSNSFINDVFFLIHSPYPNLYQCNI